MDAFAAISELTFAAVAERLGVGASERAVQRLQDQVREAIKPFVEAADSLDLSGEVEVTTPIAQEDPDRPLEAEALVGEAVGANMAMTDLNTRLDTLSRELEQKVEVLASISDFGRSLAQEHDPRAVLKALLEQAKRLLDVKAAGVLVVPRSGPLREELLNGIEHDPLLATVDEAGQPLIMTLVEEHQPRLFARLLDEDDGEGFEIEAVEAAGFGSAVVVPLVAQDRILGVLTGYAGQDRPPLEDDDLQLATVLASVAAVAHLGAESWSRLEDVNRDLEQQVAERIEDLQQKNRLVEDAYRELAELDRVKDDLMTRVSSELKAPVASVLNAAKVLAEQGAGSSDRGARFISIIRDEAAKLSELIQSVVQASMLASGGEGAEAQEVPIEELLRGAVAPLRDLATERGVGLNIMIPSGLKTVHCDPDTVSAALGAVVKNALEHTEEGGSVKLEVRRTSRAEDAWLAIRVIDTGVGMGEEDLERSVEAFWQGGDAPGGGPRGLGLGLTIARRVAESHGGSLKVTSTLGEGTEVTLSLPQQAD
jgi:signal transduction histidine kinase